VSKSFVSTGIIPPGLALSAALIVTDLARDKSVPLSRL
jgi:hypothetical protein